MTKNFSLVVLFLCCAHFAGAQATDPKGAIPPPADKCVYTITARTNNVENSYTRRMGRVRVYWDIKDQKDHIVPPGPAAYIAYDVYRLVARPGQTDERRYVSLKEQHSSVISSSPLTSFFDAEFTDQSDNSPGNYLIDIYTASDKQRPSCHAEVRFQISPTK